jgi:hypothetical protein
LVRLVLAVELFGFRVYASLFFLAIASFNWGYVLAVFLVWCRNPTGFLL